jgi:diguanylate cyclase (GGDEF)-like protein/PAS domain S-box-containing protein
VDVTAARALERLLRENPDAVVAAIGSQGAIVPMPASVPLCGQQVFEGASGLELVIVEDQVAIIEAWARAADEPIVRVEVHPLANPEQISTVQFLDVRAEHGVHVAVFEALDRDELSRLAELRSQRPPGVARAKKDAAAMFLEIDDATTKLLGWAPEDVVGRSTIEFVHPDDTARAIDGWIAMRAGTGSGRLRVRYKHANGHYVWLEVTNDNRLDDPELACVLSEMVDISAEMAQFEALQERERLLARLAEALPIGICHVRSDRLVVYSNEALMELLGPVDSIDTLMRSVCGADRRRVQIALEHALRGRPGSVDVGVVHGPVERRCELTFRTMTSDSGSVDGVIVCAADVTDRSRLREELEHRASHDALTGCLNREATVTTLERSLQNSEQVGVAYIDLDHFKEINDELGHAAGDELLRVAASRLRSAIRAGDELARLGGDEFAVICRRADEPLDSVALGHRLREAIDGDVVFAKQRIALRASVGVAISFPGELDAEAVLHRADTAMYAAKRRAHGRMTV